MATTAKAILKGVYGIDEIAAIVSSVYAPATVVAVPHPDTLGYVVVEEKSQAKGMRQMFCLKGECADDKDVYDGPRTVVTLGAYGEASAILESVLSVTGGFMDPVERDEWKAVVATVSVDYSAEDRLVVELGKVLPAVAVEAMRKAIKDPDVMEAVVDAFGAYREAKSDPAPAP